MKTYFQYILPCISLLLSLNSCLLKERAPAAPVLKLDTDYLVLNHQILDDTLYLREMIPTDTALLDRFKLRITGDSMLISDWNLNPWNGKQILLFSGLNKTHVAQCGNRITLVGYRHVGFREVPPQLSYHRFLIGQNPKGYYLVNVPDKSYFGLLNRMQNISIIYRPDFWKYVPKPINNWKSISQTKRSDIELR